MLPHQRLGRAATRPDSNAGVIRGFRLNENVMNDLAMLYGEGK
jgi:hypothetical protein